MNGLWIAVCSETDCYTPTSCTGNCSFLWQLLPGNNCYSFTYPRGMESWVGLLGAFVSTDCVVDLNKCIYFVLTFLLRMSSVLYAVGKQRDSLVVSVLNWRSHSNCRPVSLCTMGLGLLNLPFFLGREMSTGYGWEGLRQVCAMLLSMRLCGGLSNLSAL